MAQRLGQHFLTRRSIVEQLAEAACPGREPLVIEIGPGRGALTAALAERAERLIAIELDRGLAAQLRVALPRIEVVEADVLSVELGQWGPAVLAGNLPYYITSPILERIFRLRDWRRAVVLVQREVAERLTSPPGRRDYGFLTVEANLFSEPEILFRLPPGAFSPPPKVDSAAVLLKPRAPAFWGVADPAAFLEFAGRAFHHKRKTIRNNLAPFYGRQVDDWPEARLRAEQIPMAGLVDLFRRTAP